jgi:hypothetical protein
MRHVWIVTAAVVMTAACGGTDEDAARTETPPWGLDGLAMPATAADVSTALDAMPADIDGRPQSEPFDGRTPSVHYGSGDEQGVTLFAMPMEQTAELAGEAVTPLRWLTAMAGEMDAREGSSLDPDEPLVWVAAGGTFETGPGEPEVYYVAAWADPDGDWVFWVTADTEAARTGVIHAFIDAVAR